MKSNAELVKAIEFSSRHKDGILLEIRVPVGTRGLYIGSNSSVDNEWAFLINAATGYKSYSETSVSE